VVTAMNPWETNNLENIMISEPISAAQRRLGGLELLGLFS